ncbi:MAG: NADPH:quinone oxidoreductase family protein [Sphingobium sp.]
MATPRAVMADELGPIAHYALRPHDPGAPRPGQVRVEIRAAGISFADMLTASGRYQVRPPVPFIPGSECAGVVEAVGAGVTTLTVGQKVVGTGWHGMFAEAALLPEHTTFPMPDTLSFAEGSVLLVSYATVVHALIDRGRLQPGESLLVMGAGGAVGLAAVTLGRHLGAHVIASASSTEKRELALAAGAAAVVDARSATWRADVKAANGGRALDMVFDPVGGAATEPAFRLLGWGGRHLVVGFPGGIPALPTNLPLLKGASLVGVNIGALPDADPALGRATHARVLELAAAGVLRPAIARTYPLEAFADAMAEAQRGDSAGRIILEMTGS